MSEHIERHFVSGIVVQRKTTEKNGIGGQVETWGAHLEIKGRIRPLTGAERAGSYGSPSGDKVTLFASHRLYCLPCDITEVDRVIQDGKIYQVVWVANLRGRFLQVDLGESGHEQ